MGYSLLVFVYEKTDNPQRQTGSLDILHTIFVEAEYTADYQTTSGIRDILQNHGNQDDIDAFLLDRYLPVDDIQADGLAAEILENPPGIGYLTVSREFRQRWHF